MNPNPTIKRWLIIPNHNGTYARQPLPTTRNVQAKDENGVPLTRPKLDANGEPLVLTVQNPDGSTATEPVTIPVLTTEPAPPPQVSGYAFVVDLAAEITPEEEQAAIRDALSAFQAAHPEAFPRT